MKRFLLFACLVCLWACNDGVVYNEFKDLEANNWHYDSMAIFNFRAEQGKPHDLFYNIRYNLDYPYYNLYVKYELSDAQGNLLRSSLQEANLMHPDTGVPLGSGESIFDSKLPLLEQYEFPATGDYQFKIKQYMRLDTLPGILAVGVTLETPEKN
ncbi:MAG: gliding motility lipoprotein GldH [Flammeovirgaceae bacterium]